MLNNTQIKYFIYQASNLKYVKDATISIFSVLLDIKKDRKRAHKVFPLISFFFLYPSPFCYPSPEQPIHDEKKIKNRPTEIKSYTAQILFQPSESSHFLTSLNCCHMVSADMYQTLESLTHQVFSKIVNKNSKSHQGSPKSS